MKNLSIKILSLALLGAAGCASPTRIASTKGVGPAPTLNPQNSSDGFLQVYTAREQPPMNLLGEDFAWNHDFGANSFLYDSAHTGYSIYASDGQLVSHIENNNGMNDATPTLVKLSPGSYEVAAKAVDFNNVTYSVRVPVCVEAGLTTSVHLDGSGTAPAYVPANDLVRLPNGQIVGVYCPGSGPPQQASARSGRSG